MYGMTAARTLAALQHLYELKLATYPRTDSRYITHDDLETLTALLESGRLAQGFVTREGIPGHPRRNSPSTTRRWPATPRYCRPCNWTPGSWKAGR